jgi:hypothetical protein
MENIGVITKEKAKTLVHARFGFDFSDHFEKAFTELDVTCK